MAKYILTATNQETGHRINQRFFDEKSLIDWFITCNNYCVKAGIGYRYTFEIKES